jgi:transcriptional regulator with XRE-family HTH domain
MNVNDEEVDGIETDLAPQNIVDTVVFGRRLRAQRVLMGFDRVQQLTHILRSRYGIDVSDRTVYAIERGEQMPHVDFFLGACAALGVHPSYFTPALKSDLSSLFVELRTQP